MATLWLALLGSLGGVGLVMMIGRSRVLPGLDRVRGGRISGSGDEADAGVPLDLGVVIPARNEADKIALLVADLRQSNPAPARILVVDDGSSDATAELARAAGAEVLAIADKPEGWNGKSYACWRGAQELSTALLLFLDADMRMGPQSVGRLAQTCRRGQGLVSVQPWHEAPTFREQLSAAANLLVAGGLNAFGVRQANRKPAGAFGPCLCMPRAQYFRVGGHEAVRSAPLEDIPFGRLFADAGISLRLFLGDPQIRFRMYPKGWGAQWRGWGKSLALGAAETPKSMVLWISLWLSGASMIALGIPLAAVLGMPLLPLLAAAGVWCLLHLWAFRRVGSFGPLVGLLWPLPLLYLIAVQLYSSVSLKLRGGIEWHGRKLTR